MSKLKKEIKRQIDESAEQQRAQTITKGSGQILEYVYTALEADAAASTPDPLDPADYPMLEAERQAMIDAGLSDPGLRAVADQVANEVANWKAVGATIKRNRRAIKIAAENYSGHPSGLIELSKVKWPVT